MLPVSMSETLLWPNIYKVSDLFHLYNVPGQIGYFISEVWYVTSNCLVLQN